jgi:hypothetical protein
MSYKMGVQSFHTISHPKNMQMRRITQKSFWSWQELFLDIILFIQIKNINIKMIHGQGWNNALLALGLTEKL